MGHARSRHFETLGAYLGLGGLALLRVERAHGAAAEVLTGERSLELAVGPRRLEQRVAWLRGVWAKGEPAQL